MEKPKDYYQLLGVPRDASPAAIRRAFRRLARRAAPDRAENDYAELQAAYETLSDAERRRRYDDELGGSDRQSGPHEWSFTRRPAAYDLRRPLAPTSLTAEIVLHPEEAAAGTVLSLDVPVAATCEASVVLSEEHDTVALVTFEEARARLRWPENVVEMTALEAFVRDRPWR